MVAMFPRVADITGIRVRRCATSGASGIWSAMQFPGAGARLRGGWRLRRAGGHFFSNAARSPWCPRRRAISP